ncbi:small and basic intrinsic protein 2,1 [Artemisia annua]|uniref:Small and basic intrinsic protein 2,1 n=1 Tax=Artemisia annua TaxID=35608 RepID=A0A2U1MRA6_ARTAN|nr:small and basic intrinsic protein 2,1 [Artemisia annua]
MAGIIELLISDMTMSFMWVWSSVLIKIFVHDVLGYHHYDLHAEIIRYSLSIMNMFLFAYLAKVTKGGAYNPLTVLSSAISGSFGKFLFTIGSRIPLQANHRCSKLVDHHVETCMAFLTLNSTMTMTVH